MKTKSILTSFAVIASALTMHAQTPLSMNIPSAPKDIVIQNDTQIEKIIHTNKTSLKVIQMPKRFGPTYTLSLWVKLEDSPALKESKFSNDAPPTIVDMHSKDINEQRCVIRVHNGKFVITELLEGPSKWKTLESISTKAEPGKWYHLVYSHAPGKGIFYVNGNIVARTSTTQAAPQEKLQNIIFGRFQSMRRLDGTILQPRLYADALNSQQIRELYQTPPAEAK